MTLPKNIIIVEDEVITQRYLQDIFAQQNIHVSGCFSSAKETMIHIKDLKCDMLLMDINIQGPVDGIQLARQILRNYEIPIIFITAHNDDETLEEILELAPYGFIAKPFSSKEVLITLQIAYKRYVTHSQLESVKEKENIENVRINQRYCYSQELGILYEDDLPVKLNKKQTLLIEILVKNINYTVGYDMLVDKIWEKHHIADSALRTLVYSLRKLLPELPLVSHSKMGYMLKTEKSESKT